MTMKFKRSSPFTKNTLATQEAVTCLQGKAVLLLNGATFYFLSWTRKIHLTCEVSA